MKPIKQDQSSIHAATPDLIAESFNTQTNQTQLSSSSPAIPEIGTHIMGRVVGRSNNDNVSVDLGNGLRGRLAKGEVAWLRRSEAEKLVLWPGRELHLQVSKVVFDRGSESKPRIVLSLDRHKYANNDWDSVISEISETKIVKAQVLNFLKDGTIIELANGLRAYIPNSELSWTAPNAKAKDLLKIGETIDAKILSINKEKCLIFASYRKINDNPRKAILEAYPIGASITGTVLKNLGLGFVLQLPDTDCRAFLHKNVVPRGAEKYQIGDRLNIRVLDYDYERLTLNVELTENPYRTLLETCPIGSWVTGTVKDVTSFGLLMKLPNGTIGLLHKNDLKSDITTYQPQQEINVRILSLDQSKMKIGLGM